MAFTFGHVRQLDAVASRFVTNLALSPVGGRSGDWRRCAGDGRRRFTPRRQALGRRRADDRASTRRCLQPATAGALGLRVLWPPEIAAALKAGADVSVTVRLDNRIKAAISSIPADAWTPIEYTYALYDEGTRTWISRAEVAEISFTDFAAQKKTHHVPGRLVVRRIPDLHLSGKDGQDTLFDTWRFHAFFTTTDPAVADTVAADKTHRRHAITEQVHSDLKHAALAHLPSGKFAANTAWLVLAVMALNLTRAAATITGPALAKATIATIRRKLIAVPARVASSTGKTDQRGATAVEYGLMVSLIVLVIIGAERSAQK